MNVVAADATALAYQWSRNSAALTDSASRSGSTTASLAHTAITMTGFDGSYSVRLTDLAGNVTTSNVATIVVNKAPATVTLGGLAQTYDGAVKLATATTTPAGLTVALTYDGSATAPTAAGSYAVVATVNDTNYTGTASGTLVIGKASQTIAFTPVTSAIVNTPVTLTATASSGLSVTFSVVSGNATISGASFTPLDANPITLRATQSGNGNYTTVTADQTVTNITKLTQTITFAALADKTRTAPAFALSATASSSLPVTFTVASGPATLSGSTLTLIGIPGVVTVRASQAGNAAYSAATDVTRSFTVSADYPAPTPDGYAASVTGGAGSSSVAVTVSTAADFRTYANHPPQWSSPLLAD
ncbi:MAG: MBG domain-containing protein [Nibricoccus sp.]